MKYIKEFLKSAFIGVVLIYLVNYLGQFINYNVPINLITISILGFLRLPGLILIVIVLSILK